jgi:hypothetical protein
MYNVSFDVLTPAGEVKTSSAKKGLVRKDISVLTQGYATILEAQHGAVEPVFEKSDKWERVAFVKKADGKETYVGGIKIEKA